jgi:hypothetical protein
MVLLGISVVAMLISALRLATERTPLPSGSSYSTQPDGAMALYAWAEMVGASPQRLRDASINAGVSSLVVLQPESTIDSLTANAFDEVAAQGGTLVLAGDSVAWLLYVRSVGITVEPVASVASTASTPDGLSLPFRERYRLRAAGGQSLLVLPNGDTVGLRVAYKGGAVMAIASADPLSNVRLNDPGVARFVYREIVSPAIGRSIGFDEMHHSFAPGGPGPATISTLLFDTAPGRALLYIALLTFVYLLLSGRRLGPPLPARDPTETHRTMYEHVQMLADLYRRAGQFRFAHDYFTQYYAQLPARGARTSRAAELEHTLSRVRAARTDAELVAALADGHDPG